MLLPPTISELDVLAVQALLAGKASSDQQLIAMGWVLQEACQFSNVAPDDCTERQAAMVDGRRAVGMLILQMKLAGTLAKAKEHDARKKGIIPAKRGRTDNKRGEQ